MKLLLISDAHSNPLALRAILAREGGADMLCFAGDLVDYGPDPIGVIDWVKAHGVRCVMGNHDENLIRVWREHAYEAVPPERFGWVHHNCRLLSEEQIAFLAGLPEHLCFAADGVAYLMAHRCGEGYRIIENQYDFDRYWDAHFTLPGCAGMERRMIFGHTHRQMVVRLENGLWINPGSASYRREDDPDKRAQYAVIEDGRIDLRQVAYDRGPLFAEALRLRPQMAAGEYRVAEFFFGLSEADGPLRRDLD